MFATRGSALTTHSWRSNMRRVKKEDLLRNMFYLRALFRLLELDVSAHSDEAIADGVLQTRSMADGS